MVGLPERSGRVALAEDMQMDAIDESGKNSEFFVHYTMNIFASKSGHLSNRLIERFFFNFSKHFTVFYDFSKWRVSNLEK